MKVTKRRRSHRAVVLVLVLAMLMQLCLISVQAKTTSSAKADNIFFYATDADGKAVLLKVLPLSTVKTLAHGQDSGENYYISTTDNYPTTQYTEAKGFTIPELVDYVKSVSSASGVNTVTYSGSDTMRFMATDSYGSYTRSWTYDELYGVERYYFEGLYDASTGWNTGWEVGGEDNSKYGISLDTYDAQYKDKDAYYENKRAVLAGGQPSTVILATESYSGRTTSDSLVSSTEVGIAGYISKNSGTVAGCLSSVLSDECALRLCIPMTEADLMSAHRTAYDNFKWVYNLCLEQESSSIQSKGTVAEPVASFKLSGNTLTITFSCATSGASIYYGWDGAPQTLYTGPITVDVTDRNLDSNPVTVYATAVKEGYDDAGIQTYKYPGMAPTFETLYSGSTGQTLTFQAASSVSATDWTAWTSALTYITMKTPSAGGYVTVPTTSYQVDNTAKTITFDSSLFTETGSYSFIFHATKYADKSVSITMKQGAPTITAPERVQLGKAITLTYGNSSYSSGLSLYVTPAGGSRTMISSSYLDRSVTGQVTIKESYFTASSSVMKTAGTYTLELVNNSYTPASQTVTVTLTQSYPDVSDGAWYKEAVDYVTEQGLFQGSDGKFLPTTGMNRAMFVTVVWRLSGSPKATTTSSFTDVSSGAWYKDALDWAVEAGVTDGLGDGKFGPSNLITREQVATMLLRYEKVIGGDTTATGNLSSFTDANLVSSYAQEGMAWAVGHKIINGDGNRLKPKNTATRAEVAQMLMNYLKGKEAQE